MNMNTEGRGPDSKKMPPLSEDELTFRPITEGLGFHHSKKNSSPLSLNTTGQNPQRASEMAKRQALRNQRPTPSFGNPAIPSRPMPSVSWNQTQEVKVQAPTQKVEEEKIQVDKLQLIRAFFIDLLFVVTLSLGSVVALSYGVLGDPQGILEFMKADILAGPLLLLHFATIFLLYFSLGPTLRGKTLGQSYCQVPMSKGNCPRFEKSFLMALRLLVNTLLLGLPGLFGVKILRS